MAYKVAHRGKVPPFIAMEVLRHANERAAAGHDVLHLEIGQPGSGAPRTVIEAAHRALDQETLGYTEALGLPVLRQRIARHYAEAYRAALDWKRVVITTGSSGGFLLAFLSAFDAGDRIALASPGYPAYRNILTALGLEPVELEVGPEHRFQPTPELLSRLKHPPDGLIVASPSNPCGTMLDRAHFEALLRYCRAHGIRVVSDEIYHGITYGMAATSATELEPEAIVINSFSKYYAMTGWRLGWMVVPASLLRSVESLAQNLFVSPQALPQHAARVAFDAKPELDAKVAHYAENRALLLRELPKAGFDRLAPADGAFYLFADIGHLTNDSTSFCEQMLDQTGVAATPGVDFDPARGHRFLRFSFAGSSEDIAAAARRLVAWRR
ncbi:MAG TPA: aminotransferase class I/II-fold pyridoxal phosphate-dependent enzyme [Hypericibacter adhaerens]|jgi:aspartate/methionine/tyrosine aminotransferase|uniref:pyridoxal phosphate-dependent aminotransferase n=1 Tax=Hypericibacter adhaerens TaxID=2602016 RepID=UPI002BB24D05|nr:aminotransferase class I/II-fold pyridoxal phosphate-dependent enzyme [Hypericibacter adhaerens]HWA45670.1 aminotransferase class I/II-fold pyridoxal phosphate-dependent enzyme [Hypericibacter adhaerens]